jgi:hypothetical protein
MRGQSSYRKVSNTGDTVTILGDLNTKYGVSGDTFERFLEEEAKKQIQAATDPMLVLQLKKETATERLDDGSCCTDGLFVCAEGHHINGDALQIVKISIERRENTRSEKEIKKNRERRELKQNYDAVLAKSAEAQRWTVSELKTIVQWFKMPSDPVMLAQKQNLMQRYEQTKLRTVTHVLLNEKNEPEPADTIDVKIEEPANDNENEVDAMMLLAGDDDEVLIADESEDEFEVID